MRRVGKSFVNEINVTTKSNNLRRGMEMYDGITYCGEITNELKQTYYSRLIVPPFHIRSLYGGCYNICIRKHILSYLPYQYDMKLIKEIWGNFVLNHKNHLLIKNCISSFLDEHKITNKCLKIDEKWEEIRNHCNISENNNKSLLYRIPCDVLSNVFLYCLIEEYNNNILQITKYIHDTFGPKNKWYIIQEMIINQSQKIWFNQGLMNKSLCNKYLLSISLSIIKNKNHIITDSLYSWQICGSFAWKNKKNKNKTDMITKKDIDEYKKKSMKLLSISSSLYLLNFIQISHYAPDNDKKYDELLDLLLFAISSGAGSLGIRIMIYYFVEKYFVKPLKRWDYGEFPRYLYSNKKYIKFITSLNVNIRKSNIYRLDMINDLNNDINFGYFPYCKLQIFFDFNNINGIFWDEFKCNDKWRKYDIDPLIGRFVDKYRMIRYKYQDYIGDKYFMERKNTLHPITSCWELRAKNYKNH